MNIRFSIAIILLLYYYFLRSTARPECHRNPFQTNHFDQIGNFIRPTIMNWFIFVANAIDVKMPNHFSIWSNFSSFTFWLPVVWALSLSFHLTWSFRSLLVFFSRIWYEYYYYCCCLKSLSDNKYRKFIDIFWLDFRHRHRIDWIWFKWRLLAVFRFSIFV